MTEPTEPHRNFLDEVSETLKLIEGSKKITRTQKIKLFAQMVISKSTRKEQNYSNK